MVSVDPLPAGTHTQDVVFKPGDSGNATPGLGELPGLSGDCSKRGLFTDGDWTALKGVCFRGVGGGDCLGAEDDSGDGEGCSDFCA